MNFEHSERSKKLQEQVEDIFTNDILPRNRGPDPAEDVYFWQYVGAYRGGTVHGRQGTGGSFTRRGGNGFSCRPGEIRTSPCTSLHARYRKLRSPDPASLGAL